MHNITLNPVAGLPGQPDDTVVITGDVLTVNDTDFDLSAIPEDGTAEPQGDHPFAGTIRRDAQGLHYGLIWRYASAGAAPDQPGDPAHWLVQIAGGPIPDPITRISKESEA